ncbi:MAG: thymidylate synthase [Firmicutes bacterium]|nr:thymidylate synthase [Bacillota bacterium]
MKEFLVEGRTLPEAYHKAVTALHEHGEISECPDYNQRQKELTMTMFVAEPLEEPMISKLFIGGFEELEQYRQEVLDGVLDFRIGHGWDYTYHQRIAAQLPFIYEEFARNPYTRRAVIDVRDVPKDTEKGNDSPACLQHIQFFIRGGKLHMKVLMRSNDAPEATFMNAFAFILLLKRVADQLGVGVGTYTHRANSFHCYEKDFGLLEGYVNRVKAGGDITYEYEGFFDAMMEEARPAIAQKVENIRKNLV